MSFICVLGNKSMPGLVNIRMVSSPEEYRDSLFTEDTPTPFEIVCSFCCVDESAFDEVIQGPLAQFRLNPDRDFYQIDEYHAVRMLLNSQLELFYLETVHMEEALQEEDVNRYSAICGVHPFEIKGVLKEISPNAWKAAVSRYEEKKSERIRVMGLHRDARSNLAHDGDVPY